MSVRLWITNAVMSGLVIPTVRAAYAPTVHSRQTSNTSTISWTACPDYTNPNADSTVSIFLRKYPATAPPDQRLGSLLVNPGGPGGSGSGFVVAIGDAISTILDGRYDIIGFDPRAVNLTAPSTACHNVEYKFADMVYQLNMQGAPFPHVGGAGETASVAKLSAIQSTHPTACAENGNHEMLRNSGTVAVAKDMEKIVEALGEDGLNYLGYSYGTILGATFAAIRPNLVKRMVLDGVSDAESYFNDALEWGRGGIQDTPKTFAGFISTCIDAGPTQCALAVTKDNKTETVQGLANRIDALYTKLGREPLVVGDSLTGLASIEQGHGRDYYPLVNSIVYGGVPEPYTRNVFNRSMQKLDTQESFYPIFCGDSQQLNITVEKYADYFRELGELSPMGEQVALMTGDCRGWPFRATERYTGPWTVEKGLSKTKFPILFVSLDADPITPLGSAAKMNRGFGIESASLLIQQGFGHCSPAHPSLCTIKNIRDYLVDGKVPQNGTHCTPEPGWIYPTNSTTSKRAMLTKREKDLLEAVEKISHVKSKLPVGLGTNRRLG